MRRPPHLLSTSSRSRGRTLATVVVVLACVSLLAHPAAADPPDGPIGGTITRDNVVVDGDSFGAGPSAGRSARASTGYALAAPGIGVKSSYVVRMVTNHPNWSNIADEVTDAAADVAWVTGAVMTMGSPIGSPTLVERQITVQVSSNSPCGPLSLFGTIGCGGWYSDGFNEVIAGEVFICPCMVSDPTLFGVVIHELGHVMGLAHFASSWEGQLQVMYPVNQPGLGWYRSGDVSGLRRSAMNGYGNGVAPTHRPGPPGPPSASNGGFARIRASWPAAAAYGLGIDHHQIEVENLRTHAVKTGTLGSGRSGSLAVTGGDNYRARIRAHNSKGWGGWSNWSNSTYVTGRCIATITDVSEDSAFCGDITWLLNEGITEGYPDGAFRPGTVVSRQAMAAFLMRNAQRLVPGSTDGSWGSMHTFTDVPTSSPFHNAIEWMAFHDIAGGFPNGQFGGGGAVSRQAMARMLMRFTEYLYPGSTTGDWNANLYPDVPGNHPFHDEITWLSQTGIGGGYPDGTFRPGVAVSRGSMAAFLHRHDTQFG